MPRRSLLFVPAENQRALNKAQTLPADGVIIDLEDGVSAANKLSARAMALKSLEQPDWDDKARVLRINGQFTDWWQDDLAEVAMQGPWDAVLLPKVVDAEFILAVSEQLSRQQSGFEPKLWIMCENAIGVSNLHSILGRSDGLVEVIVMGTSDLAVSLGVPSESSRLGMLYALSQCVLAARTAGLDIIDGVHLSLGDAEAFSAACSQGVELGFNGKTLIHPQQIATANEIFTPSEQEYLRAMRIISAWERAEKQRRGVCLVDGELVEYLHVKRARRILSDYGNISPETKLRNRVVKDEKR